MSIGQVAKDKKFKVKKGKAQDERNESDQKGRPK